jgi:phosphonate degradation associated HDIG domain protein
VTAPGVVDAIAEIFARRGSVSYLGEQVTMAEHMLQAAALAEGEGAAPEQVVAALLHDLGHFTRRSGERLLAEGSDNQHEEAGARFLAPFFPAAVVEPIRWHVAAKRYLVATDSDYAARLTDASLYTLELQGGPMTEAEVVGFKTLPHLEACLRVRRWDDAAKVPGCPVPGFEHYRALLESLVRGA